MKKLINFCSRVIIMFVLVAFILNFFNSTCKAEFIGYDKTKNKYYSEVLKNEGINEERLKLYASTAEGAVLLSKLYYAKNDAEELRKENKAVETKYMVIIFLISSMSVVIILLIIFINRKTNLKTQ
ncbi:MAG: hypothetical protein N2749_03940 [Clostridia bacterium]|nr:hypothetical protein [Clostridia bacterium]